MAVTRTGAGPSSLTLSRSGLRKLLARKAVRIIKTETRRIEVPDTDTLKGCVIHLRTGIKVKAFRQLEAGRDNQAQATIDFLLSAIDSWEGFDLDLTPEGMDEFTPEEINHVASAVMDAIKNPQ